MPKLRIANISSMPLERRLPLLIGGLVTVVLACTLLGVRWELRGTSEEAAAERLEVVSDRIGTTLANAAQQRAARYREVASDPAVLAYALGRSSDASSVRAVLSSLRTAADGDLPVQLRNAAGRVIAAVGDSPGDERPVGAPLRSTDIVYGRFMPDERAFTYWVSIPVIDRGAIVGHVTLQRGSSASAAGEFIEGLLGSDMALHLVHADGGPWAGFDARLLSAMPAVDTVDAPFTFQAPDGQPYLAHAADVPGTPWRVVTHMPLASVTARTDAALRRIAVAGAFLLGLALLGAWLVGRGVARPIARLGSVADAIAAGDYSRRAHLGGEDEIGRLGGSFDAMAVRIERTHAELQRRFREAQGLAGELELANSRLHSAISDAEQARADAQAASSAKSEFLATMSHEIRTPINAIVGYADLLDLGTAGPLTPEQARFVERIRRSSEHLTSVVNDVLDFAKIESGQMRIEQQVGSARAVIDDAVAMFHAHAAARSIAISVRSPLEDVFLGDARRVQQILINLLSNAIKFTAAGGRVTVESERRESVGLVRPEGGAQGDARAAWTCIAVRDDGVGIEPDQLGAIFEPFVQGAGGYTRTHGGTGLGLAISRSLARMMDGDLTGESTPGEGSTFTLWLPHPAAVPAGSG